MLKKEEEVEYEKINWKDILIRCLKTFIQGVVAY